MSVELAAIEGIIELKDEYTSTIGLAEAALEHFTHSTQESLKAVAEAGALVGATFTAIGVAIVELGERGSLVNDVRETFEHFSGSAEHAEENMAALREGVQGTVKDFTLAKDAAHLLSAGVELNAEQFKTIAAGALVLHRRGLGETADMLNLVSNALVTGRTRAIAMAVGVVDAGDAEAKYAAKLGITKELLSDTGKVEAKRLAVMEILEKAVHEAGEGERNFAEQLEIGKVALENWGDDLASAVANSDVFKVGLNELQAAVTDAFGGQNSTLLKDIVNWLEQAVIIGVNFGLGMVEGSRVIHTAWSAIELIVLQVAEGIVAGIGLITQGISQVAKIGELTHVLPPGTAAEVAATAESIYDLARGLDVQAMEAKKGVEGTSEFDKTLDKVGGTLFRVKDAMGAASQATDSNTETLHKNNEKIKAISKEMEGHAKQRAIDEEKVWKIQEKSLKETEVLWGEYFAEVAKGTRSSFEQQELAIDAWRNNEVAKLDASDRSWKEHYDAINAVADARMKNVGSTWSSVADKSIDALNRMLAAETDTYNKMISSGRFFREDIDAQKAKIDQLTEKIRNHGQEAKEATSKVAEGVQLLDHSWVQDGDIAAMTLNKTTVMVRTLSGEIVSLAEAQARQRMGNTIELSGQVTALGAVGPGNLDQIMNEVSRLTKKVAEYNPGPLVTVVLTAGDKQRADAQKAAAQQHADDVAQLAYLQKLIEIIKDQMTRQQAVQKAQQGMNPPSSPSTSSGGGGVSSGGGSFVSGGGTILPGGSSQTYPKGIPGSTGSVPMSGGFMTNNIFINDTLGNAARRTAEEIMKTAKLGRQFGTA